MSPPDPRLTDAQILALKAKASSLYSGNPDEQMAVSIVRTMGKNLSDGEWVGLYRGVVPQIIPLSPKQLEAVRGGMLRDIEGFPFPSWPWRGSDAP